MSTEQESMFNQLYHEIENLKKELKKKDETIDHLIETIEKIQDKKRSGSM